MVDWLVSSVQFLLLSVSTSSKNKILRLQAVQYHFLDLQLQFSPYLLCTFQFTENGGDQFSMCSQEIKKQKSGTSPYQRNNKESESERHFPGCVHSWCCFA